MNVLATFFLFVSASSSAAGPVRELPAQVTLKSPIRSFTSQFEFGVVEGRIWFKPVTAPVEGWSLLGGTGLPDSESDASIRELSADGDTLVVVNEQNRVYDAELTHDKSGALKLHWSNAWGWPFRLAARKLVMPAVRRGWANSILNSEHGTYYSDPAGNPHLILGISTLYVLSADGRSIRFDDPWLPPNNFDFHIAGPERGALPLTSISASGSTLFVMDQTGRMFTRLVDFDTLGGNPGIPYSYTVGNKHYKTEGFWPSLRTRVPFLLDVRRLPGDGWHEQPRITELGAITKNITILQNGKGNDARELRVEGQDARGNTGYYSKRISRDAKTTWTFVATQDPLLGELLDTRQAVKKAPALGEDHSGEAQFFEAGQGSLPAHAFAAQLTGFNTYFEPATLSLWVKGERLELILYLNTGIFPFGDNDQVGGTLVVPAAAHDSHNPWVQELLQDYLLHRRAYAVKVSYGKSEIRIEGNVLRNPSKNSFVIRLPRK